MITDIKKQSKAWGSQKMKQNTGVHNVIHSLKPLLMYEQLFGIFRFRIKNESILENDWKIKCIGLLLGLLYSGFFSYFLVMNAPSQEATTVTAFLDLLGYSCSFVGFIVYIVALIIHLLVKSSVNVLIISSFARMDSRLHLNIQDEFYRKSRNYNYFIISASLFVNICFTLYFFSTTFATFLFSFLVNIVYVFQDVEISFVSVLIYMLKIRLAVLNSHLNGLVKYDEDMHKAFLNAVPEKKVPKYTKRQPDALLKLRELSLTYDFIGETCCLINSLFHFQIFIALISCFSYILMAIWVVLYSFRTKMIITETILSTFRGLLKLSYILALSLVCESLMATRSDTKVLVNMLVMDYEAPPTTRAQAKAFMQLIDARPLRICVYDILTVDITLMLKFINVSATYLIIIIQISHFNFE